MLTTDTPGEVGPTCVIELTPPGRAAVAVVVVEGPQATWAVGACFHPAGGRSLADVPFGRIVLGRWGDKDGEELIVCRRSDTQVEIHCHGGAAAVNAVVGQLLRRGCRQLAWRDWLQFTDEDTIRSAARVALAEAPTFRTASILLDQLNGALSAALQRALAAVTVADWPRAATTLDTVLAYRDVGLHLTTPWHVVLVGPANVGKSSLLNALAGFRRSIVSNQPGTTRDVVTLKTAIDGWPVELSDTAGLRDADDELESAGIALTAASMANADLLLIVGDATQPHDWPRTLLDAVGVQRVICVTNKIDLCGSPYASSEGQVARATRPALNGTVPHSSSIIATSAVTGQGLPELISAIGLALVPSPPPAGSALPFTEPLLQQLDRIRRAIAARDAPRSTRILQSLLARPPVRTDVDA